MATPHTLTRVSSEPTPAGNDTIGVLICDDVEAMRTLLRVVVDLSPRLHVVGEARDGNEAVSQAERVQPDVVLLDLSMPVRTGLDALPDIKAAAPAAAVIVLSGLSGSIVEKETLEAGASRFLEKGMDPQAIVAAIEDVYAGAVRH